MATSRRRRPHIFWPILTLVLALSLLFCEILLSVLGHRIDLGVIDPDRRALVYTALTGVAGGLLGLILATLAILLALPDREVTKRLRRFAGWRALEYTLLATAFNLFLVLILGALGLALDAWIIGVLAMALAGGALFGLLISGGLFALLLANIEREDGS